MASRVLRICGILLVAVLGAALAVVASGHGAAAQVAPPGLGTAASFAVLGGQSVTNTGASVISGDIGVSPGTSITGFPPGVQTAGTTYVNTAEAAQAQLDLIDAYDEAAGLTATAADADFAGETLVPGVYGGPTLGNTGQLTLDALGDPNAVWVFQAESTLITDSASSILLVNGANPCNVYWQIGSSATLGTNSTFVGTVMALTSITAATGAVIDGRLLSRNGSTTLDTNTITSSACAPPTTTTTTTTGGGGRGARQAPGGTGTGGTGTAGAGAGAGGAAGAGADGTGVGTGGPGSDAGGGVTGSGSGSGAAGNGGTITRRDVGGELAYTGAPLAVTALAGTFVFLLGTVLLALAGRRQRQHLLP